MSILKFAYDLSPKLSLRALSKSGRVLKGFAFMYLPFHNLGVEFLFDNYGIFAYISAALYDADEANEQKQGDDGIKKVEELQLFLKQSDLLDQETNQFIEDGFQYLAFERAVMQDVSFTHNQLIKISASRSVDFRIMHRILFRIIERPFDEAVFKLYAVFETLFEIEDDLGSYSHDVAANTFNIYDLLVRLHGNKAPNHLYDLVQVLNDKIKSALRFVDKSAFDNFNTILKWYRIQVPAPKIPDPIIRKKRARS